MQELVPLLTLVASSVLGAIAWLYKNYIQQRKETRTEMITRHANELARQPDLQRAIAEHAESLLGGQRDRIRHLEERVTQLETAYDGMRKQRDEARDEVERLEGRIRHLEDSERAYKDLVASLQSTIAKLRGDVTEIKQNGGGQ